MPDYTKNYNFIKPKKTENYDIDDVTRKNMDITDTELFNKQNKEPGKGLSTNDFTNAYKTKLDSLKNYDDTELKKQVDKNTKNIQDIEKEQLVQNSSISSLNYYVEQNSKEIYENSNNIITLQAENTALKEELERQKEDNRLNGLTEDNEGEMLHITNTTGARFNSLEIFGNEKQKTREGYNKLENHLQSQTINGVNIVINSDKSITLNGTATAFFQLILLDTDDTPIILSPKTYTMSLKGKKLGINFVGTENGVDVPYLVSTVTTESVQKTYQSETIITKILCAISQGTQLNNVKLYPMIYEGTDEKEYEEYGAMPSFDYSSEVKAVGGIELKVENKNVFSFEKAKRLATYAMPSYEVIDNNNIELKNSNDWAYIQYQYTLKKNTQYTISFDLEFEGVDNVTQWWTMIEDSLGSIVTNYVTLINNKYIKTFSTREDSILKIKFYASTVINPTLTIIKNIQIEEKNSVTDYIAHEEQSFVIPVQQRMFSGDKFVKVDGIWKEMHTMGTVYSKDVSNIVVSGGAVSGVEGFYRYNVNLQIANRKGGSYIRILSNYFKYGDSRWNNKEGICGWENGQSFSLGTYNKNYDTADKLKEFLTENNVEFDYELAEPLYLDCTKEQIEVLDKIEKEAHTYLDTTNVYTEDEVGAIIKTNTNVDLKSIINNIQEQLIAE